MATNLAAAAAHPSVRVHPPPPPSGVRLPRARAGSSARDDAELVRATLDGDPSAATAIWHRYVPLVRRRLRTHFNGPELEDHVQEVFARCFEHLRKLREPASLRSFLIGISLRLGCLECRRRRFQSWAAVTPTGDLPEPAVYDDIEGRFVVSRTRVLFSKLTPVSYEVLELRFIRGQELTEVAETMGVSLATAKRQLARAAARVATMAQSEPVIGEYLRQTRGKRVRL